MMRDQVDCDFDIASSWRRLSSCTSKHSRILRAPTPTDRVVGFGGEHTPLHPPEVFKIRPQLLQNILGGLPRSNPSLLIESTNTNAQSIDRGLSASSSSTAN